VSLVLLAMTLKLPFHALSERYSALALKLPKTKAANTNCFINPPWIVRAQVLSYAAWFCEVIVKNKLLFWPARDDASYPLVFPNGNMLAVDRLERSWHPSDYELENVFN
jgi:hypothetical protein